MANPQAPPGGFQQGGWYEGRQYWGGTFGAPGQIHPQSTQQGAGQAVSKEVNIQSAQAQGVSPQQFESYLTGQRKFQDTKQVTGFLNDYQSALTTPGVESLDDIMKGLTGKTTGEILPKGEAPPPPDYLTQYAELRGKYDLDALDQAVNDLYTQIETTQLQKRQRQEAERGKPVALGVIEGRVSEIEKQESFRLESLSIQLNSLVRLQTSANNTIQTMMNLTQMTYEAARNDFNDQFDRAIRTFELVRGIRQDQLTEQQRNIDNARATLQIYANAITSGNLTVNNLDPVQTLQLNRMELMAGLPMGFTQSLQMSPKDRILTFSDDNTQALVVGANGQMQVIQTGLRASVSATSDTKATRQQFGQAATISSGNTFSDLVENYANVMSLQDIYQAYLNSEMGKTYGTPVEDKKVIQLTYKVATGEMTEDEARLELELSK